jgi:hypothetical protein
MFDGEKDTCRCDVSDWLHEWIVLTPEFRFVFPCLNSAQTCRSSIFSLFARLRRHKRLVKKPSLKSKSRRACKKSLTPMHNARVYKRLPCAFCWTVKKLVRTRLQKCSNWTIKIKLIACWSRYVRDVSKLRSFLLLQGGIGSARVCAVFIPFTSQTH